MKLDFFKIIEAQVRYTKYHFNITIMIFLGIVVYSYIRAFSPVNLLCFLMFVHFVSLLILNNHKEGRERIFRLVTLTSKEVALSRILMVFISFGFLYILSALINFFTIENIVGFRNSNHELFMFGGIGLLGIFVYIILADYFTMFKSKFGFAWFNIVMGTILAVFGFLTILTVINAYDNSVSSSTILISLIYICSIMCAVLSYFTYQNRELYLR